jgi:signal transduction histidine kinase
MMPHPYAESTLLVLDSSLRRQKSIFAILNLLLFAALLLSHMMFASYFGDVSLPVVAILGLGLMTKSAELIWLRASASELSGTAVKALTWWSIVLNTAVAALLAILTQEEDSQYFVLMVVPILEAAFRLNLAALAAVVLVADSLNFLGVYTRASVSEYFEAGTTSLIFTVMGALVWLLVNNLRDREFRVKSNLEELERARERLLVEEKISAVGRLSRAIAHEIRNPVAVISMSLATAMRPGRSEEDRKEMFAIAASESARLERLTTDFLSYARPLTPRKARANVAETLNYVAAVARVHSSNKAVSIEVEADGNLEADFDSSQMQQALLNLVLNAIDACDGRGAVTLRAEVNSDNVLRLDVVDPAGPIPPNIAARIFEPFFTAKPGGTGLGLAIARNIVRAHGGDLVLSANEPGRVCFSVRIPQRAAN